MRGHLSYKDTFSLQQQWCYKRGTSMLHKFASIPLILLGLQHALLHMVPQNEHGCTVGNFFVTGHDILETGKVCLNSSFYDNPR